MDPLPQYPDHAFIPYLRPSSPTDPPPINLLNTSTWTYCGPLLEPTSDALPPSFHTWATSTIDGPLLPRLLPFLDFLHGFLSKAGAQHYWLTIRVTKPTSEYDVVRWHTDDLFFDYDGEKDRLELDETWTRDRDEKMTTTTTTTTTTRTRTKTRTRTRRRRKRRSSSSSSQSGKKKKTEYWKMATTLLGPGTLFLQDGAQARLAQHAAKAAQLASRSGGPHTCTSFRCPNCLDAVEAVRQTLAHSLASEPVESPQYGQVAFFRLGSEKGAVHSEPRCPVDRIFVNVVPGSETELSGLMSRWGMDFPTSWCFGVPIDFAGEMPSPVPPPLLPSLGPTASRRGKGGRVYAGPENEDEDEDEDEDTRSTTTTITTSTMSLNLHSDYTDWLREKGFHFNQIFGPSPPRSQKPDDDDDATTRKKGRK